MMEPELSVPLDAETLAWLNALPTSEYKHCSLPSKDKIETVQKALFSLSNAFEDAELVLYFRDAFAASGEPDVEERLIALSTDLQILHMGVHGNIPDKRGRNPLPAWMYIATEKLTEYYQAQTGKDPIPYFDDTYAPSNDFTKWFCKVLAPLGVTTSNCKTLLKPSNAKKKAKK